MLSLRLLGKLDRQELDLLTNDPIPLNYNFRDLSTLKPSGNYSQTFRIPASPLNEEYFNGFFDVNYAGNINPKRKVAAVIIEDTVPLMYGHIQIKSVIYQDGKPEYEICFFGETVDLWKELGSELLSDMDWTDYDHDNTNANIQDSLDESGAFPLDGTIKYGIIDRGSNWSTTGEPNTGDFNADFQTGNFTPFIKVKTVIDEIFDEAGFTYESTFIDSANFGKLFMPLYAGNKWPVTYDNINQVKFNAGLLTTQVVGNNGYSSIVDMSDSSPFYDVGSNFTIGATNYYTPPWAGMFTVTYWATTEVESGYPSDTAYGFHFGVLDENDNWIAGPWLINQFYTGCLNTIEVFLSPDHQYRLGYNAYNSGTHAQFLGSAAPDELSGTGWKVSDASYTWGSGTLDIGGNFPKMLKVDFIKSLVDMFNLVMVSDKKDPKKVLIEPYNDYQGSGDTLDWTKKMDTSKDYVYSPTTDIQKKRYSFKYTESGDYICKSIQESNKRTYGRYLIDDSENDFSTSELKVEAKFGAYPITAISGTNIIVHKAFDDKLKKIKEAKPLIVYDCGEVDITNNPIVSLDQTDGFPDTFNTYVHFSNVDAYAPTVDDYDLNFGQDVTFYPVSGNPVNTLFNTYWREAINQLYSSEARIMEAYFTLDAVDINQFKFSDRIFIKDSYWRVEDIQGYKTGEGSTKVKLIKILNSTATCEYTPTSINSEDLTVTFEDGAGTESGGNKTCCELYGYTWSNGACYGLVGPGVPALYPSIGEETNGPFIRSINSTNDSAAFLQGESNFVGNSNLYSNVNGVGNTLGIDTVAALVAGDDHNVGTGSRSVGTLVTGQNTISNTSGRHFGGRELLDDQQGLIQSGEILMHVGDTGWTSTTAKNLLLDGSYLNMPNETMWSVQVHIVVEEWVAATPAFVDYKTIIANANWWKDRAIAKAGAFTIQSQTGTLGTFALATDVLTDTAQHRLQITYNGTTITNPIKVTCRLTYVQTVE
jgi:hypothetical protein